MEEKYKYLRSTLSNLQDCEIYLDDSDLEEIITAARKELERASNIGFKADRMNHNPREKAFAEEWEKINDPLSYINYGNGILQDLFYEGHGIHSKCLVKITLRDRMIVATIIQWLGTNIGFSFLGQTLNKCGYKISKIDQ